MPGLSDPALSLEATHHYLGLFKVYKNGSLIRCDDCKKGIEPKLAQVDILEPSNKSAILGKENKPVYAYLKDGTKIYYTKEKIIGIYSGPNKQI